MKITITTGIGDGPTPLAAFDKALLNAGVANYNLIYLSSIIPPNSVIERRCYVTPADEYGHRLYLVMSCQHVEVPGTSAWAGIGWTQESASGKGLFVELHGGSQGEVERAIDQTLTSMIDSRPSPYGSIQCEVVGTTCVDKPVCALVLAVYKSEGWDD